MSSRDQHTGHKTPIGANATHYAEAPNLPGLACYVTLTRYKTNFSPTFPLHHRFQASVAARVLLAINRVSDLAPHLNSGRRGDLIGYSDPTVISTEVRRPEGCGAVSYHSTDLALESWAKGVSEYEVLGGSEVEGMYQNFGSGRERGAKATQLKREGYEG
ncbi:hypothetical protein L0F63_000603 [Massospora cicadina]|nr:hypothetical protein L0F63_000603 [Massospora cicadina]